MEREMIKARKINLLSECINCIFFLFDGLFLFFLLCLAYAVLNFIVSSMALAANLARKKTRDPIGPRSKPAKIEHVTASIKTPRVFALLVLCSNNDHEELIDFGCSVLRFGAC